MSAAQNLPICEARQRMFEARAIARAAPTCASNLHLTLFNAIETLLTAPIDDLETVDGITAGELSKAAARRKGPRL